MKHQPQDSPRLYVKVHHGNDQWIPHFGAGGRGIVWHCLQMQEEVFKAGCCCCYLLVMK